MTDDPVNPSHYTDMTISPIEVMIEHGVAEDFAIGSVLKYLMRAKVKNGVAEDYRKARWYLNFLIARREGKEWHATKDYCRTPHPMD